MSEYSETNALLDELLRIEGSAERQTFIDRLTDRQVTLLHWRMPGITHRVKSMRQMLKRAQTERRTDYDRLIKKAKELFTPADIEILSILDDELAWYTKGIVRHLQEDDPTVTLSKVQHRLRLLKRRGLIEVVTGLVDDDGMLAGSGYMRVYKQNATIRKIIDSYNGESEPSNQGALL